MPAIGAPIPSGVLVELIKTCLEVVENPGAKVGLAWRHAKVYQVLAFAFFLSIEASAPRLFTFYRRER